MNRIIIAIIMIHAIACVDKSIVKLPEKVSFQKIGKKLTAEETQAVKEAQNSSMTLINMSNTATSRKMMTSEEVEYNQNMENLNNFELVSIPYYHLDGEKFYTNPNPDSITQYLYRKDLLYIIGKQGSDVAFKILLGKPKDKNGKWDIMEYCYNWDDIYAWLPPILEEENVSDYFIFSVGGWEFLALKRDGKFKYYRPWGHEYSPEKATELIITLINQQHINKIEMDSLHKALKKDLEAAKTSRDSLRKRDDIK